MYSFITRTFMISSSVRRPPDDGAVHVQAAVERNPALPPLMLGGGKPELHGPHALGQTVALAGGDDNAVHLNRFAGGLDSHLPACGDSIAHLEQILAVVK